MRTRVRRRATRCRTRSRPTRAACTGPGPCSRRARAFAPSRTDPLDPLDPARRAAAGPVEWSRAGSPTRCRPSHSPRQRLGHVRKLVVVALVVALVAGLLLLAAASYEAWSLGASLARLVRDPR